MKSLLIILNPFKKNAFNPTKQVSFVASCEGRQPLGWQERWAERKRWETGRERERVLGRREEASQTDCLAAPGSPALSVIWFPGQRLSSLMNIGPVSHLPHKRKGSCFHSAGLESLFQESILPTPDCKPVSMQRSYVHKYYLFFLFFFFWSFISLPERLETPSHSSVCCSVITEQRDEDHSALCICEKRCTFPPGFGRLQFSLWMKVRCCFVFMLYEMNGSAHAASHDIPATVRVTKVKSQDAVWSLITSTHMFYLFCMCPSPEFCPQMYKLHSE